MKINDAKGIFTAAMNADDTVLMTGLHGIGKTEVVRQWAKENDVYLEVLYLSTQEVGDLIGTPETVLAEDGSKVMVWTKPIWLHNLIEANKAGKKTALFLDELSRAALDVRQASLQLVLDRQIHQHKLPILGDFRTLIIAADNPDNGDYSVDNMDPALLDRFLSIYVEVDATSWLDWGKTNNLNKMVLGFVADNKTKLHYQPEIGSESNGSANRVGATPRSWTKLAKLVDNFNNTAPELYYPIISGKIGTALAAQFISYMKNYTNLVSVEDIENLVGKMKSANVVDVGNAISELLKDTESAQINELTYSVMEKHLFDGNDIVALGMLYSLHLELLAAFLTTTRKNDTHKYTRITELDNRINNKALFKKILTIVK